MSARGLFGAVALALAMPVAAEQPTDIDWRKVATDADRSRLRGWRRAWIDALAQVRAGGAGAGLAADVPLFDPDRVLAGAMLAPGRYRCRMTRLAGHDRAARALASQLWAPCIVGREGGSTTFATEGLQRTAGHLFADTDARVIYLGTLALPDERSAMKYGRDAQRDMAGFVERIGEHRWRLVLPYPAFESTLDIVEIVPVTE